jgi:hypothetical protein
MSFNGEQLVGLWVACRPFERPHKKRFPRLILSPDGTGVREDGDYPATYAVTHFKYGFVAPTVIQFSDLHGLAINNERSGLEIIDPFVREGPRDCLLHTFGQDIFIRFDLAGETFCRFSEYVENSYRTNWPWGIDEN